MGILSGIAGAARFIAEQSARPHLPVSEAAVNKALARQIRDVHEVRSANVGIRDGHFNLSADVVRGPDARFEATFAVVEAHVSAERQFLVLDQVGEARIQGQSLTGKLIWGLTGALFSALSETDPVRFAAQRAPGIVVNGTLYSVDLSAYNLHTLIHQTAVLQPFLRANTYVQEISCRDGRFNVYFGADAELLKREAVLLTEDVARKATAVIETAGVVIGAAQALKAAYDGIRANQLPPPPSGGQKALNAPRRGSNPDAIRRLPPAS